MSDKKNQLDRIVVEGNSPFTVRVNASKQDNFDKYYYEVSEKTVFKSTGQKDSDGNDLGVAESVFVVKKLDIKEYLDSQKDSVGVESYIRALSLQGEDINSFATGIDPEKVNDFSQMPETLAEVLTAGDKAKAAFANLDPALKGSHTTIEGFLNGLTKDSIDRYIASKLEALIPAKKEKEGE